MTARPAAWRVRLAILWSVVALSLYGWHFGQAVWREERSRVAPWFSHGIRP